MAVTGGWMRLGWVLAALVATAALASEAGEAGEAGETSEASEAKRPTVELVTSEGSMTIELRPDQAPRTVDNFLKLVDDGFYDGLIFHRVIAAFMIQAGGYDARMNYREAPRSVVNESANGLGNKRWTIAMARRADPDSAGAQFFINVVDNPYLDAGPGRPGYTVFGRLIAGQSVARAIELAETATLGATPNVPVKPITILAARRVHGQARPLESGVENGGN